MKIVLHPADRLSLEEFADKHNLTMDVRERNRIGGAKDRYFACFYATSIKEGHMLRGNYGDGATPAEAIEDYAQQILSKELQAWNGTEYVKIFTPEMWHKKPTP